MVWCFGSVSVFFLFSIVRFTHSEAATEYTLKIYTRVHNCISSRNSLFVFFSFGIHYSFQFVCSFSSLFLLFTLYWICVLHAYSVVLIAGDEIKQKFTWWHLTRIACLFICSFAIHIGSWVSVSVNISHCCCWYKTTRKKLTIAFTWIFVVIFLTYNRLILCWAVFASRWIFFFVFLKRI